MAIAKEEAISQLNEMIAELQHGNDTPSILTALTELTDVRDSIVNQQDFVLNKLSLASLALDNMEDYVNRIGTLRLLIMATDDFFL